MNYVYKIEVEFFKFDGVYEAYLWCRQKDDADAEWQICSIFEGITPEEAFNKAYRYTKKYTEIK